MHSAGIPGKGPLSSLTLIPMNTLERLIRAQNIGRKGSRQRSDKRKIDINVTPGDPNDPTTFIEIKRNEQKLAGYLGFVNTTDLRRFALSWPIIKAFFDFNEVSSNLAKSQALELIRDDEQRLQNEEYPDLAFPLQNKGKYGERSQDTAKRTVAERTEYENRCSHVAWILLRTERNINAYISNDEERNSQETKCSPVALSNYLDVDVPEKYPGSATPKMHHEGESRLEAINRCWSILKYIQEARQNVGVWHNRFASVRNVSNGRRVDQSQIPHWMRSGNQGVPQVSSPTVLQAVTQHPSGMPVAEQLVRLPWLDVAAGKKA